MNPDVPAPRPSTGSGSLVLLDEDVENVSQSQRDEQQAILDQILARQKLKTPDSSSSGDPPPNKRRRYSDPDDRPIWSESSARPWSQRQGSPGPPAESQKWKEAPAPAGGVLVRPTSTQELLDDRSIFDSQYSQVSSAGGDHDSAGAPPPSSQHGSAARGRDPAGASLDVSVIDLVSDSDHDSAPGVVPSGPGVAAMSVLANAGAFGKNRPAVISSSAGREETMLEKRERILGNNKWKHESEQTLTNIPVGNNFGRHAPAGASSSSSAVVVPVGPPKTPGNHRNPLLNAPASIYNNSAPEQTPLPSGSRRRRNGNLLRGFSSAGRSPDDEPPSGGAASSSSGALQQNSGAFLGGARSGPPRSAPQSTKRGRKKEPPASASPPKNGHQATSTRGRKRKRPEDEDIDAERDPIRFFLIKDLEEWQVKKWAAFFGLKINCSTVFLRERLLRIFQIIFSEEEDASSDHVDGPRASGVVDHGAGGGGDHDEDVSVFSRFKDFWTEVVQKRGGGKMAGATGLQTGGRRIDFAADEGGVSGEEGNAVEGALLLLDGLDSAFDAADEKLGKFVRQNVSLYEKMLMFHPVDPVEIQRYFQEQCGYKIGLQGVRDWLLRRGIVFAH